MGRKVGLAEHQVALVEKEQQREAENSCLYHKAELKGSCKYTLFTENPAAYHSSEGVSMS
jgi:hypothetical protein